MGEKFTYRYSAEEAKEAEQILKKYTPQEETALEKLRRLDQSVTKKGSVASITAGIVGTLILGGGMSLIMEFTGYFVIGIILGIVGLVIAGAAYPLFKIITEKEKKRIAPHIIELSNELRGINPDNK